MCDYGGNFFSLFQGWLLIKRYKNEIITTLYSMWFARLSQELPTFNQIPFAQIVLYQDDYRRTLPK